VAVVQPVIDGIGAGLIFLLFAGITALLAPLLVLEWVYGERWRGERRERLMCKKKKRVGDVKSTAAGEGVRSGRIWTRRDRGLLGSCCDDE